MKKIFKSGLSILALATACCAHPGHDGQAYGIFWKHPGCSHPAVASEKQIWRYAFVSVYQWSGSR
jgi:hypothetical protein